MGMGMSDIFFQLSEVLKDRRKANPNSSYVASLHEMGLDKILEKIGEESTELIISAKNNDSDQSREEVVGEVADLWFHCMILLSHLDGDVAEVIDCLQERFGISGLEEKASRKNEI